MVVVIDITMVVGDAVITSVESVVTRIVIGMMRVVIGMMRVIIGKMRDLICMVVDIEIIMHASLAWFTTFAISPLTTPLSPPRLRHELVRQLSAFIAQQPAPLSDTSSTEVVWNSLVHDTSSHPAARVVDVTAPDAIGADVLLRALRVSCRGETAQLALSVLPELVPFLERVSPYHVLYTISHLRSPSHSLSPSHTFLHCHPFSHRLTPSHTVSHCLTYWWKVTSHLLTLFQSFSHLLMLLLDSSDSVSVSLLLSPCRSFSRLLTLSQTISLFISLTAGRRDR